MLSFSSLSPIAAPPVPEGVGLPVTPEGFPLAARQQAHIFGFATLRFKRSIIAPLPLGGIVGRSQIARNVVAFVYATAADARAAELKIGCAPLPNALELALTVWVTAMALCDGSLTKPTCNMAMLSLLNALKPGGPPQVYAGLTIRAVATWEPGTAVSLSIVPNMEGQHGHL